MTLQQAISQAKPQTGMTIRPEAWSGMGVALIWDEAEHGWIGWDFRGWYPRVIVDEPRLSTLGFESWQVASVAVLKAEGARIRGGIPA